MEDRGRNEERAGRMLREVEMWMREVEMRMVETRGLQAERPYAAVRRERFRSLWREEEVG